MIYTTNNTVVLLDSIGNKNNQALLCQTSSNMPGCTDSWLFPNGSEVQPEGEGFYRGRTCSKGQVRLLRRNNALSPTGRYCCISGGNEYLCVILSKWNHKVAMPLIPESLGQSQNCHSTGSSLLMQFSDCIPQIYTQ